MAAEVTASLGEDHFGLVELHRPPNNFLDLGSLRLLADAFENLDADPDCRVIVLAAEGKHFCAGADLGGAGDGAADNGVTGVGGSVADLYDQALRLAEIGTPVVAAVNGAAIGAGLGLALMADFRVAVPQARFSANFARLGFHHGFGLTVTLPAVAGQQPALRLLYTGERIDGDTALRIGLVDQLASPETLREEAAAFAAEIALSAPLAVRAIKTTMRGDLPGRLREALATERTAQEVLRATEDFAEGVRASSERRLPRFTGR